MPGDCGCGRFRAGMQRICSSLPWENAAKGTVIRTDAWRGYEELPLLGFNFQGFADAPLSDRSQEPSFGRSAARSLLSGRVFIKPVAPSFLSISDAFLSAAIATGARERRGRPGASALSTNVA